MVPVLLPVYPKGVDGDVARIGQRVAVANGLAHLGVRGLVGGRGQLPGWVVAGA